MAEINFHFTEGIKTADLPVDRYQSLAESICTMFNAADAQLSIAVVDDKQMAELNKKFTGRDIATDVLSFDLSGDQGRVFEVIVNADKATRQATLRNLNFDAELALYITHGLLHGLGFDDSTDELAEQMHRKEDEILQQNSCLLYTSDAADE